MEGTGVYARTQHPDRFRGVFRTSALHVVRRVTERNPAIRPSHDMPFKHADRQRIPLRDVLKRRRHETGVPLDPARDLSRRNHVRLLPAMNDVPSPAEQWTKASPIDSEMRMRSEPDVERNQRARFSIDPLELDRSEITAQTSGSGGGDFPSARTGAGHLVCQPAVLGHHIGVTDRQQAFQTSLRQPTNW